MAIENIPSRIHFFIHPLPLSAVLAMALNDHWLKYRFANAIMGKLSDFCGIFYLPIFLLAILMVIDELFSLKRFRVNPSSVTAAIAFTDFLLILVKLSAPSARLIEDFFNQYLFRIQLVQDPTDLFALVVNPLTYLYLRNYWVCSKLT